MEYDDSRWNRLKGGYGTLYNPAPVLAKLRDSVDVKQCWEELWNDLHHQGDVGEASYAALIELVKLQETNARFDWNFYALAGTIELQRNRRSNPPVPGWLKEDYAAAMATLFKIALRDIREAVDPYLVQSILGVLALLKGQFLHARLILESDESEIREFLGTSS